MPRKRIPAPPALPPSGEATFDTLWTQLTPLEKDKARWAADQKGVSLPNLLRLFPAYRHQ